MATVKDPGLAVNQVERLVTQSFLFRGLATDSVLSQIDPTALITEKLYSNRPVSIRHLSAICSPLVYDPSVLGPRNPANPMLHHASIRTADIHRAIAFYERLGFTVQERFTTGMTLACWMEGLGGRIELIQIPEPHPAADAFHDEHYTGYYHLSFDLTDQVASLPAWLAALRQAFADGNTETGSVPAGSDSDRAAAGMLRVLLEPQQQIIGDLVYEVVFLADADGLPLEFIRVLGHVSTP
jgi:catechol 2,3-dioxygenase-like lactoylglutathione lyase family enzyme